MRANTLEFQCGLLTTGLGMISVVTSLQLIACVNVGTDLSLGLGIYWCGAHAHFSRSLPPVPGSGMYHIASENTFRE